MRFGLQDGNMATIQQTLLLNLSESGVAFITTSSQSFAINDLIMVEIPIPNSEQIAWWARVVRVQTYEPNRWWGKRDKFFDDPRVLVAATFEKLPEGHSRALRKGIERSFLQAARDQRYRTINYYRVFITQHFVKFLAYLALCALAFGLLYWWTRPDAKYDKGVSWGERFKF